MMEQILITADARIRLAFWLRGRKRPNSIGPETWRMLLSCGICGLYLDDFQQLCDAFGRDEVFEVVNRKVPV